MTERPAELVPTSQGRRRLIYALATAPIVAAVSRWSTLRSPQRPAPTETQGFVANAFDRGQELLKKYPQPKWLPQHFKVDTAFACSQDRSRRGAFVDIEESAQLCILMRNTKASSHGQFINSNVSVFIAPASRRPEVRGIARRWSEPFSLSGATAESVEARYYDSEPHDHSAFGAAHGIVTVKTGFAVLVMSFHKNGLSRQDLEEIAMSVS